MAPRQLLSRVARRARYRFLYPRLGDRLFRLPELLEAMLRTGPSFREEALARSLPLDRLIRDADTLARRRFSFLNLPTVDLGDPVDWSHASEGDRLWHYNLHYGE